ncbi:MAG: hypothetical protein ACOCWO_04435 [Candidatus Muiribacteriaceae bacterium]
MKNNIFILIIMILSLTIPAFERDIESLDQESLMEYMQKYSPELLEKQEEKDGPKRDMSSPHWDKRPEGKNKRDTYIIIGDDKDRTGLYRVIHGKNNKAELSDFVYIVRKADWIKMWDSREKAYMFAYVRGRVYVYVYYYPRSSEVNIFELFF